MRPISQGIATSYPRISRLGFPTPGMLPVSVPAISTIPCPPSCAADVDPSEESARSYSVMNLRGRDNYSDQPTPPGGGGARVACGGNPIGAEPTCGTLLRDGARHDSPLAKKNL